MPTIAIGSNINPGSLSLSKIWAVYSLLFKITHQFIMHTLQNKKSQPKNDFCWIVVHVLQSVTEVPGRQLIHNGDLVELDPESLSPVQKVHCFLLNDSLMIASWLPNRWVLLTSSCLESRTSKSLKLYLCIVMLKIGNFTYKMTLTMKVSKISR